VNKATSSNLVIPSVEEFIERSCERCEHLKFFTNTVSCNVSREGTEEAVQKVRDEISQRSFHSFKC